METSVVKKDVNELATTNQNAALWGSEGITAAEIKIPKMLIMQGLSDFVTTGEAKVGQVVDSLTKEILGGQLSPKENKDVEFVPFYSWRSLRTMKLVGTKYEFHRQEPLTMANETLPWEDVEMWTDPKTGQKTQLKIRRDKVLNFYVLRPSDMKEGFAFPYVLSFSRLGMNGGTKLATYISKLNRAGKTAASKVFALTVKTETNEKGTFFVPEINVVRDTTPEEYQQCFECHTQLTKNHAAVKIDDIEEAGEIVASTAESTDF